MKYFPILLCFSMFNVALPCEYEINPLGALEPLMGHINDVIIYSQELYQIGTIEDCDFDEAKLNNVTRAFNIALRQMDDCHKIFQLPELECPLQKLKMMRLQCQSGDFTAKTHPWYNASPFGDIFPHYIYDLADGHPDIYLNSESTTVQEYLSGKMKMEFASILAHEVMHSCSLDNQSSKIHNEGMSKATLGDRVYFLQALCFPNLDRNHFELNLYSEEDAVSLCVNSLGRIDPSYLNEIKDDPVQPYRPTQKEYLETYCARINYVKSTREIRDRWLQRFDRSYTNRDYRNYYHQLTSPSAPLQGFHLELKSFKEIGRDFLYSGREGKLEELKLSFRKLIKLEEDIQEYCENSNCPDVVQNGIAEEVANLGSFIKLLNNNPGISTLLRFDRSQVY